METAWMSAMASPKALVHHAVPLEEGLALEGLRDDDKLKLGPAAVAGVLHLQVDWRERARP
eukprot:CAMPEP_0205999170 /NCGR_PEP_ID=MMETSP1464-20131121/684_1 /ASSEMBLY_ACC=CAM_ASM_001124 /TAXON_ID=119497 /ORGANISM="Exanthemachrysis gayraliae, Strain RCC1523" /LENGTH=60 /DNA_ID=CAMNT_0053372355 /DNA_START=422 /DNA_END=599 /DNA_ORIENTATION=+